VCFRLINYAILLFSFFTYSFCEANCRVSGDILRQLFGENFREDTALIEQHLIQPEMKKGRFRVDQTGINTEESVIIGIANYEGEGTHHYYLIAKNARFDGQVLFFKPKVKETAKSAMLTNGGLFEIQLSPDIVESIYKNIKRNRNTRGITCLHGLCKVLEQSEIKIGNLPNDLNHVRSHPTIQALMSGDVRYKGERISPDKIRFYANSQEELERIFTRPKVADAEGRVQVITQGAVLLMVPTAIGAYGYAIFSAFSKNNHNRCPSGYVYDKEYNICRGTK